MVMPFLASKVQCTQVIFWLQHPGKKACILQPICHPVVLSQFKNSVQPTVNANA